MRWTKDFTLNCFAHMQVLKYMEVFNFSFIFSPEKVDAAAEENTEKTNDDGDKEEKKEAPAEVVAEAEKSAPKDKKEKTKSKSRSPPPKKRSR